MASESSLSFSAGMSLWCTSKWTRKAAPAIEMNARQANPAAETMEDTEGLAMADRTDDSPHPYLTWRMAALAIMVSMGGLIFGYDIGQIGGFLAIDNFKHRFGEYDPVENSYYFSNIRAGLIVGLLAIGDLVGALISAPLADKLGRKLCISAWCIMYIIGNIVQISSEYAWYQIVAGRFVGGFGIGALSILVPLYVGESAPTHIRAMAGCLFQLAITLGILIANIINFGTESIQSSAAWRITLGIGFLWPLTLGFGMLFFPETPKFAYRQGNALEARKTMARLLGVSMNHKRIADELREMKEQLDNEKADGNRPWHEIFTGPRMAYRTLLGIAIMSFQQLTGANFFFYYGTVIFSATGLDNPFITQIILGTINVACTFPGLWFVERFGRRSCLILGASWMCVCFLVFASVGHFALDMQNPANTPKAGAAMVVFASLFIAAFSSTWGPMSWVTTAEMYPPRYRAVCMSLAIGSNWTWVFMIAFFTPFVTEAIDYRYGYLFAACCAAAAIVVYCFLLEPKGRTMEELDRMYKAHVKPWDSSKWTDDKPKDQGADEGGGD